MQGAELDPARIKIADLSKTFGDPLIGNIRKHFNKKNKLLKNNYEIPTVFSDEPIVKSDECEADTSRWRLELRRIWFELKYNCCYGILCRCLYIF